MALLKQHAPVQGSCINFVPSLGVNKKDGVEESGEGDDVSLVTPPFHWGSR